MPGILQASNKSHEISSNHGLLDLAAELRNSKVFRKFPQAKDVRKEGRQKVSEVEILARSTGG